MEKKELGREDVIEALKKIAFGRVNRGVELTYLSEPTAQLIRKMDLSAVAEFKRNANGTVEVKFVDRVKALSWNKAAAEGGDPRAQETLARLFVETQDGTADPQQAYYWACRCLLNGVKDSERTMEKIRRENGIAPSDAKRLEANAAADTAALLQKKRSQPMK